MKIEIMKAEHIPEIAEIQRRAFGAENAEETLKKELENKISVYLAAVDSGGVVGYIGIWNICGEGDIMNIAAREDCRRKGVGSALMDAAVNFCRKHEILFLNLEVRETNEAARAFYKKCGFKEVGLRKRYYEGKEAAVLMRLDIQQLTARQI